MAKLKSPQKNTVATIRKRGSLRPLSPTAEGAGGSTADSATPRWTFFTNHSHVLILLSRDPSMVLREVANRVGITERAVQRIIVELEEGGFIEREKTGRRNHYTILANQQLRHPIEAHRTIGDLIDLINDEA